MRRRAIVTLHDVAPHTLDACHEALAVLRSYGVRPVTLLVVPGAGWTDRHLEDLHALADDGYPLAGHGWSHRAPPPATLRHRVHAALISRDEAEHLSRSNTELRGLVTRCAHWFSEAGFETPEFYVPPAWALGRLSRADLSELPFRYYETLTGIHDVRADAFRLLPLVGYLADTRARATSLRALNAFNRAAAVLMRRPLRLSVHPPDLQLHLMTDLVRMLDRDWECVTVTEAMAGLTPAPGHADPGAVGADPGDGEEHSPGPGVS